MVISLPPRGRWHTKCDGRSLRYQRETLALSKRKILPLALSFHRYRGPPPSRREAFARDFVYANRSTNQNLNDKLWICWRVKGFVICLPPRGRWHTKCDGRSLRYQREPLALSNRKILPRALSFHRYRGPPPSRREAYVCHFVSYKPFDKSKSKNEAGRRGRCPLQKRDNSFIGSRA